jgi:hypothetical protein
MANGEAVVSQAQTKAFDEGYDRAGLGRSRGAKERGSFVWDSERKKLVRPWEIEMDQTRMAKFAPISVDRHYENVRSPIDGHVFRSRRDHKEYMRRKGLTTIDDYNAPGGAWDKAEAKRAQGFAAPEQKRVRRDAIGKRLYEIEKLPQKVYDKQVREVAIRRAKRGTAEPTE